jgi:hypothetical protein
MRWLRGAGGRRSDAEKGGTWGITKKEFFSAGKNTAFLQIFKIGEKPPLESMNTGVW